MGTMHTIHKHDDVPPVLFDDCPRCEEHAESPLGLDQSNLRRLVARKHAGIVDMTGNEYRALRVLDDAARLVRRAGGVDFILDGDTDAD